MLSPASISAAKCITPSNGPAFSVFSTSARSASPPSTSSAPSAPAKRLLWQKLSNTVTACPPASSNRVTVPPIYPAPPVTRIFIENLPMVSILDTTKVPVSTTYAYGNILAVSDWQSPRHDLTHGACFNLLALLFDPLICPASRLSQRQKVTPS